jgi:type IX secretion system PorP/SprF family membrane protein
MLKTTIGLFLACFVMATSFAQDIHWSQFNANPLFQNPGNTGHFRGDYRFIGNYRNQWRSVTVPFSTLSFSADKALLAHPRVGVGLLFFQDAAGDGKLKTTEIHGNFSYLLPLSNDSTHRIRPGISIGLNHRQVNFDAFYFDNQFNGIEFDPSLPTNENLVADQQTNLTIGIGGIYEFIPNKFQKLTAGISIHNLNRPNNGFFTEEIRRARRLTVFVRSELKIDVDWSVLPAIQFNVQGKYSELSFGSNLKYILVENNKDYRAIYGGLWLRNKDAAILKLGLDKKDWFIGVSYDINFSKLVPASRMRGGFEIATRYILHQFKPLNNAHRICPDFI